MLAKSAPRHRFTVQDVDRMLAAGVLHEDDPVELLEGELVERSPQGDAHRRSIGRLNRALVRAVGDELHVLVQCPIVCSEHSAPEPDFAIVRGEPDAIRGRNPRGDETLLVIEIAQTSQDRDHGKARLYAAAGVPAYWIADLEARRVEVHEDADPATGRYRLVRILEGGSRLPVLGTALVLSVEDVIGPAD
jgi:Uma2 family endonuclease